MTTPANPSAPLRFPDRLDRLADLARDLRWTWNRKAREVFRRLDYQLWRETAHNPVRMLRTLSTAQLEDAARQPVFVALYDQALADLDAEAARPPVWPDPALPMPGRAIAYFSAEFALHSSLPIYAGGLGVLAGDICKEASDLGLPFVALGFMYPQGYFHQRVSPDGWQQEVYEQIDWANAPIEPAMTPAGVPCVVRVPLAKRTVAVCVWRVRLGYSQLLLLDTGVEENAPLDRELSARLYGGDQETRVQQEIVLGVGGVRALRALGVDPAVWHLNEGHAAFVGLERIQGLLTQGRAFDAALDEVRHTTVFTTHTPVPAGHDAFAFQLVEPHLARCWGSLGEHRDALLMLGQHEGPTGSQFNMTALALRTARHVNGVSQLHTGVTRRMWAPVWHATGDGTESTLRTVTNGVHLRSWAASEMTRLFDEHLGGEWRERQDEERIWDRVFDIPNEELWAARQALRSYLFTFIRERIRHRFSVERVPPGRVVAGGTLLDPSALTIGFARRFTGYKRPELILSHVQRLAGILNASRRPVQIIFAGKAHPADEQGKQHLQRVYHAALDPVLAGRVAFVDDYDLHAAHFLVQGCDVWLNNPRRPLEASGTSGMKAALNGVPHLSVDDGWWAEGFTGNNGWVIQGAAAGDDPAAADEADAHALYQLLEQEVVPLFYDRDERGIPHRWLAVVKEAIRTVAPRFSTRRMVKEYVREMYAPAWAHAKQASASRQPQP